MRVFVVEDDTDIKEMECFALKSSGYEAVGFSNSDSLFSALKDETPSLIILDIMLPGEDGLSLLSALKLSEATKRIPVIIVSAKTSEIDKVRGLDLGADDYIPKPFGIMEFISRVKAVLRRSGVEEKSTIEYGGIRIDDLSHSVELDGIPCKLTHKEYELLKLLLQHPGRVFSRNHITEAVWGYDYESESRTVDMHIKTLRKKLEDKGNMIKTVRNVGYKVE